jgi:hypothetical protein
MWVASGHSNFVAHICRSRIDVMAIVPAHRRRRTEKRWCVRWCEPRRLLEMDPDYIRSLEAEFGTALAA